MLRDLASQKKIDPQVIVAAIEALKAKGWDINPNTVADEAKIARSAVYRNPALLELVNSARSGKEADTDTDSRLAQLERRNAELEELVTALELENEKLARGQQSSWQEGYEAGLKEGRGQAIAEQSAAETSPQFYAGAPGASMEDSDGLSEPEPPDFNEPETASSPEADPGTPPGSNEYISTDWLQQHQEQAEIDDVPVAAGSADLSSAPVVETPEPPADTVEETSSEQAAEYGAEAPQYSAEAESGAGAPQYSAEADYVDEQGPEDYVYTPDESPYAFAGEQVNGYGFADEEWRSGLDESSPRYAGDPEAGEFEEPLDDQSAQKGAPLSEDDLRDLLKFRFGRTSQDSISDPEQEKKLAGTKFVGGARPTQEVPRRDFVVRQVPPDIRKACLVLGLRPEELTREIVLKAWKKEMANPGTHPDVGGDTEIAVYINTAKDTLVRWLDAQAPKLGKQFGKSGQQPGKPEEKPGQKSSEQSTNSEGQ